MNKATLLYDAECAVCRRAATWALERSREGLLATVPCDSVEHLHDYSDVSSEDCASAPQLVMDDGRVYSGDALIPPLMDRLKRWHWVGNVLRLPLLNWMAPLGYRTLARNRKNLSMLMYRK